MLKTVTKQKVLLMPEHFPIFLPVIFEKAWTMGDHKPRVPQHLLFSILL